MYNASQGAPGAEAQQPGAGAQQAGAENVTDAEFEEVK
jgi:hypothetical protein